MSTPLGRICRRGLLVLSALASGLPAPILWQFSNVAEAHESPELEAQREYRESTKAMASRIRQLMGDRVHLPRRGDVIVRQSLAPNGTVMKQLLLSRDLSELQLDENSDGVMDLWEVKKGSLTVTASDPMGGRFMRLTISDKVKQGILKAEYMLSQNGRDYALWRATIERATLYDWDNREFASANDTAVEASPRVLVADARELINRALGRPSPTPALASTPVARSIFAPIVANAFVDTRPVNTMERAEIRTQAQECENFVGPLVAAQQQRCQQLIREWRNFGDYIGVGADLLCDINPENQLARLQSSWWEVLQRMNGQENLLNRLRDTSRPADSMFASACYAPERREEFERLTAGLAEIMGTSAGLDRSVVQPGSTPSPDAPRSLRERQGPFIACLERNGLAGTAARIEREFYMALEFPHLNTNKPLSCDYHAQRGAENPGSYAPGHNQIQIRMTASQEGRHRDHEGTPQNYANVLFHEYIHAAGISSEPFTHTAVACCGNPPGANQEQACGRLRGMVNEELRVKQLENLFGPNVHGSDSVYNYIQGRYGPEVADRLTREFLLGLDRDGGIVSGYGRIMNPEALRACVAREGKDTCVQKWVDSMTRYLDRFSAENCPGVLEWAYQQDLRPPESEFRHQCGVIADKIRTQLAAGMRQMIQGTAGGQCQPAGTRAEADSRDATRWLAAIFGVLPAAEASAPRPEPDPCAFADQTPQPGYTAPPPAPGSPGVQPIPVSTPNLGVVGDGDRSPVVTTPGTGPTSRNDVDPVIQPSSSRDRLTRYNQQPTNDLSRIAPRPVVRIDTEARQGIAAVERRLREATDFVGAATRGFEKLKDVAIPRAQASERENPSRIVSATTDYVPFRAPMRTQENGGRLPSSLSPAVTTLANAEPGGVSARPVAPAAAARLSPGMNRSGSAAPSGPVGAGPGLMASSSVAGPVDPGTNAAPVSAPAHLGVREQQPQRNPAAGSQAQTDLLAPILSRPWREVAGNLKNPTVVQALVDQRIVIVDPSGRRIGSRVPQRTYRFVGLDEPLKLDRRIPASRP